MLTFFLKFRNHFHIHISIVAKGSGQEICSLSLCYSIHNRQICDLLICELYIYILAINAQTYNMHFGTFAEFNEMNMNISYWRLKVVPQTLIRRHRRQVFTQW